MLDFCACYLLPKKMCYLPIKEVWLFMNTCATVIVGTEVAQPKGCRKHYTASSSVLLDHFFKFISGSFSMSFATGTWTRSLFSIASFMNE